MIRPVETDPQADLGVDRARHALPRGGLAPASDHRDGAQRCEPGNGRWRGNREALELGLVRLFHHQPSTSAQADLLIAGRHRLRRSLDTQLPWRGSRFIPLETTSPRPALTEPGGCGTSRRVRLFLLLGLVLRTDPPTLADEELLLQEGHSKEVYAVAWQDDGALVATGCVSRTHHSLSSLLPDFLLLLAGAWMRLDESGTRGQVARSGSSTGTSSRSPPSTGLPTGSSSLLTF